VFSSLLCSGTMLRRPSASPSIPREEGCSSTAIRNIAMRMRVVWDNPVGRGSTRMRIAILRAVP
jgi:hypothetical protein